MNNLRATLALLLALLGSGLLHAEMRRWTIMPSGKSIEAEYVDAEGEDVTLLVRGKEKHVKLSRLSQEDQSYIESRVKKAEAYQENKNFSERWPTSTLMEDKLRAKAVVEDAATGTYIYETSHFRFHSPARLTLATVSEMGRVFEGTYTACRALPLNLPCRRFDVAGEWEDNTSSEKLEARLFLTQADYAREVGQAFARSAGIFREPDILVPFASLGIEKKGTSYAIEGTGKLDADTLIHELTHQMSLLGATYDTPIWFAEGLAEYMRLANYKRGRFNFKGVHKNIVTYFVGGPGTTSRQLGRHVIAPPLEQMLNLSVRDFQAAQGDQLQFNYGFSALLAYYFIHLDGKGDAANLKRWMRNLQGTQSAASTLRIKIPADATKAMIEAAQDFLQKKALTLREEYHYEPLLNGRNWQELEKEFSRKVEKQLGIKVAFPGH